LPTVSILCKT